MDMDTAKKTALRLLDFANNNSFMYRYWLQKSELGTEGIIHSVSMWIYGLQNAWESHEQYTPSAWDDVYNPMVVGIWRHTDQTMSYSVNTLFDMLSKAYQERAVRYLGGKENGAELESISSVNILPPEININSPYEIYITSKMGSRARSYEARQRLKVGLPPRVRFIVNKARSMAHKPKNVFLRDSVSRDEWDAMRAAGVHRKPSIQPDWYRKSTKKELAIKKLCDEFPIECSRINEFIELEKFWDCATGKVAPEDVAGMFRFRQLALL